VDADTKPGAGETITLYTIGHSNRSLSEFLELLERHGIESLVDVRSAPYSRYVTHFNRADLEYAVESHKVRYTYLGAELGGRPPGDEFYDEHDHVLYYRVAKAPFFRGGIEKLIEEGAVYRTVFMCSEEDPTNCHRRLLIARVLTDEGVQVIHIRGDDSEQIEQGMTVTAPSLWEAIDPDASEEAGWKSIRPVSRKKAPNNSLSQSALWESDDF
jgi:uncharacterized protein (DUF488 family)